MVSEAEKTERAADILFPQPGNLYVGQHAQDLAFTPLPMASRYAVAYEGTTKHSPREFWLKLLTQKDAELLGRSVKVKSVVEIDNGLDPCFFIKTEEGYTRCWIFDAERARANRMEGWEEYYQEDMK